MKIKTISSALIELEGRRLDCGPYMSGAIEARHHLEQLPVKKDRLSDLTEGGISGIINAGRIARIWVDSPEHGYPFLSSTDILYSDLSYLALIAKSVAKKNSNLLIKEGWTLISRSGTVGRMAYARGEMDGMACTEDVLRVIPDQNKVLPGYIFAYLKTKFGLPLVISGTYGSIITHLEPSHIADLPVPRIGDIERQAHQLVQQAADELTESSRLMQDATELLFKTAGLSESKNEDYLSDYRRSGWSESSANAFTLRALNYDPRARELWDSVTETRHDQLGDLVHRDNFEGYIVFSRIDCEPEHGSLLVGQREAFFLRPGGRWISRKSIEGLGLIVPPKTTVIPCQGTFGESEVYCRAVYVTERYSQYAYSGHFYRCVPIDGAIEPGYLFAFLRSRFAFRMMRSISIGSKQQYQHPRLMASFPIPRVDSEIEKRIAQMVDRAGELQDHALDLEDQAIALVEHAIEEGGH
jgi:hypothetical protein